MSASADSSTPGGSDAVFGTSSLEQEHKARISRTFKQFDTDNSGTLQLSEHTGVQMRLLLLVLQDEIVPAGAGDGINSDRHKNNPQTTRAFLLEVKSQNAAQKKSCWCGPRTQRSGTSHESPAR